MLVITFENEFGKVYISGTPDSILDITSISGLAFPEKQVVSAEFNKIAGIKTLSVKDKMREIVIKGDVLGSLERQAKAAAVLYNDGTLTIKTERIRRKIDARCVHFGDRNTDHTLSLIFRCDSPYFHDLKETEVDVYLRINKIKTPFTLPAVFTERIWEGNCKNLGTVATEPKIYIKNHGAPVSSFTLVNQTTGNKITMSMTIAEGDEIIISVPERSIKNKNGESLVKYLTQDSFISDMALWPGDNVLKLITAGDLRCRVSYATNYTEAMV